MAAFLSLLLVSLLVSCVMGQPGVQYCLASSVFVDNSRANFTLRHVSLVTRHGDRSPVYALPIPGDSVEWNCTLNLQVADGSAPSLRAPLRVFQKRYVAGRNLLPGNCMLGQLTERGALQHRELGRAFRSLYVDALGLLSPRAPVWSEMRLRSTDIERTLLSAYNFMEGLYIAVRPEAVVLETMDNDSDNASPNTVLCPALGRLYQQIEQSANFTAYYNASLAPLAAKWGRQWDMKLSLRDMQMLNDIGRARLCHNLPLPPQMELSDARTLFLGVRYLDNMYAQPFDARKFGSGSFLQDLLVSLLAPERFHLFSAHDDTCRALLFALFVGENDDSLWPAYASHIALERWDNDVSGDQYVVMQYNGQAIQMLAPCKDVYCSIADFAALVKSYAVTPEECQ